MEIEQFIEEDMRAFLDKQVQAENANAPARPVNPEALIPEEVGLYSPSRNFERELDQAVRDANRPKAEQILDELKQSITSFPEGSPESLERKRLVERLYHRFQQGFNPHQESRVAALANELQLMGSITKPEVPPKETEKPMQGLEQAQAQQQESPNSDIPVAPPPPSGLPNQTAKQNIPPPTPLQETPPIEEKTVSSPQQSLSSSSDPKTKRETSTAPVPQIGLNEDQEKEFIADIEQVETLLAEHSYSAAIKQYRDVKTRLSPDGMNKSQRERIFARLKKVHDKIAKRLDDKSMHGLEEEHRFEEHLDAAELSMHVKNQAEAMRQYQSAKALFTSLNDDRKGTARERILNVYKLIKGNPSGELLEKEEKQLQGAP